jgi:hypothetical protein
MTLELAHLAAMSFILGYLLVALFKKAPKSWKWIFYFCIGILVAIQVAWINS